MNAQTDGTVDKSKLKKSKKKKDKRKQNRKAAVRNVSTTQANNDVQFLQHFLAFQNSQTTLTQYTVSTSLD